MGIKYFNKLLNCFGLKIVKTSVSQVDKVTKEKYSKYETLPIITKASRNGKVTGFESQRLSNYPLKYSELVFGEPGKGLTSSNFDSQAIILGQEGELNFAKSLQKKGLLDKLVTFWSIHNLGIDGKKRAADVDCVIVSGTTIWLIDLKFYASGDVIYESSDDLLYTIDVSTGSLVGKPKRMTQNMHFAQENFSRKFEKLLKYYELKTRVVFMPTSKGAGRINQVYWPGNIPAVTLEDMLIELEKEEIFKDTIGGQVIRQTFNTMLKN